MDRNPPSIAVGNPAMVLEKKALNTHLFKAMSLPRENC